jgi:tRNA threonylcarbamoyladenosine biosynthesis protein TsaB
MKILAIETSTLLGGIAVVEDERILCELTLQVEETHSSQLLPAIEYVLNVTGLKPELLDGFAIAAGPGSFTGLRIGMAAVKGLAVAASRPIVGISTLEAMAWMFPFSPHPLCPMIDARMKEVYGAWFRAEGGGILRVSKDMVLPAREFLKELREPAVFFGSGAQRYRREIFETLGEAALFPPQEIMGARASIVGILAMKRLKNGDVDDLDSIEPIYIRQAQAIEGQRKRRTGG